MAIEDCSKRLQQAAMLEHLKLVIYFQLPPPVINLVVEK